MSNSLCRFYPYLFTQFLFLSVVLIMGSGCKKKLILIPIDDQQIEQMTEEEASVIITEYSLTRTYTYLKEELTHTWMTSYDGKRFRKAHHVMKEHEIDLEGILHSQSLSFNCYQHPAEDTFVVKASFQDELNERITIDMLTTHVQSDAEEVVTALRILGHVHPESLTE